MQRGERDLGGADEVQLVLGQAIDLLLGVGQEAGAVQRALAHEHGRDHRFEALAAQLRAEPSRRARARPSRGRRAGRQSARRTGWRRAPCRSSGRPARGGRLGLERRAREAHRPCARSSSSGPSAAVGSGRLGRRAISSSRRSLALAACSLWRLDLRAQLLHRLAQLRGLLAARLGGAELLASGPSARRAGSRRTWSRHATARSAASSCSHEHLQRSDRAARARRRRRSGRP